MLAINHRSENLDLERAEAYVRLFAMYKYTGYSLKFHNWRAAWICSRFLKKMNRVVDFLLEQNLDSFPKDDLKEDTSKVAAILLKLSDINGIIENVNFFDSKRLRKSTEAILNKAHALNRKFRDAAFSDDEPNPEDVELIDFNKTLSKNLLQETDGL